jgi:hypothetical protein
VKTTPAKRVTPEDYKAEYRDLITQLAQTLNNFLDQQSTLAQKNITLNDNLKCQVLSTTLQAGITSYKFTYTLNERPTAVTVANIQERFVGLHSGLQYVLDLRGQEHHG